MSGSETFFLKRSLKRFIFCVHFVCMKKGAKRSD
nr:MAG TPA: hypothetical protein [Caudoviricetes sp.]